MIRRRLGIASGAMFACAAGLWLCAHLWLIIAGPRFISKSLKDHTHLDVKITRVRSNFLTSIYLDDVSVEAPVQASIERLTISINPWNAIFFQTGRSPILTTTLRGMHTRVALPSPDQTRSPSAHKKNWLLPSFPMRLIVRKSSVEVEKDGRRLPFSGVNGVALLTVRGLEAHWRAQSKDIGKIKSDFEATGTGPRDSWKMTAFAEDADAERLMSWWGLPQDKTGVMNGRVNGKFSMEGQGLPPKNQPKWSADLKGSSLVWRKTPEARGIAVAVEAVADPYRIHLRTLRVAHSVTVRGNILNPWTAPVLDLEASAEGCDLETLSRLVPGTNVSEIEGETSFLAEINGVPEAPTVSGSLSVLPRYRMVRFPKIAGTFSYKDQHTIFDGQFADGTVQIKSDPTPENSKRYAISFDQLSLTALARENGWKNVRGKLASNFTLRFEASGPRVEGAFDLRGLRWGRTHAGARLTGAFQLDRKVVTVTTSDNSLAIKGNWKNSVLELEECHLNFGEESTFAAKGSADLKRNTVNFYLTGSKIPPDAWPPLVARYPDISGTLDFQGPVNGAFQDPQVALSVVFHDLRFDANRGTWNGTTDLTGNREQFALRKIQVDGGYSGELSWTKANKGNWSADIHLLDATPSLVRDVLRSTAEVGGNMTGEMHVRYDGAFLTGTSSVCWVGGQINQFFFDSGTARLTVDRNKIAIEDFNLLKGPSAIRVGGNFVSEGGRWAYDVEMQMQQWGGEKMWMDGAVHSQGSVSLKDQTGKGTFSAPILWVNDYALNNINVTLERTAGAWKTHGTSDPNLAFQAELDEKKKRVSGWARGKSVELFETVETLLPNLAAADIPHGRADVDIAFSGPISDPEFRVQLDAAAVQWRNEEARGHAIFIINKSTISIDAAKLTLKSGGIFFAKGLLPRDDAQDVFIEGAGSKINLQSAFHLLAWPVTWTGEANARFTYSGPRSARRLSFLFDGKHDGFGPFQEKGDIMGEAVLENGIWNLDGIRVGSGSGYAKLREGSQIFVDRNNAGRMRLVIDARNLKSGLLTYFGRAELTGSWEGTKPGEERPPIELDVFARSLWINQFVLDGNVTHLSVRHGHLAFSPIVGSGQQISGTLDYDHYPHLVVSNFRLVDGGKEKLFLDGSIGSDEWDYRFNAIGVDADVIQGIFDTTFPVSGPMDVKAVGHGSLRAPEISAEVVWRNGRFSIFPLDEARCTVVYKDGILDVDKLVATKKKGYALAGHVRYSTVPDENGELPPPQININVTKGDLAFLKEIWPACGKAKGNFEGRFLMKEKDDITSVSGYFQADKISLKTSSYFPRLDKGEIIVRLDHNRLHIEQAKAKIGHGDLKLSGYMDFHDGKPKIYNLVLDTPSEQGISIRVPDLAIPPGPVLGRFSVLKRKLAGISRGEPKLHLSLTGSADAPKLAGKIELENTVFTYPPTIQSRQMQKNMRWFQDLTDSLTWEVAFNAGSRTWYENENVNARVTGSMLISGPSSDIAVDGRIDTEQGSIIYSGNEFKVNQAALEVFTRAPALDAEARKQTFVYIRVNAEKDVYYTDGLGNGNQDVIIMEVPRSLLGEIQPRFYSKNNPGLSPERALQLALGLSLSEPLEKNDLVVDQKSGGGSKEDTDKLLRTRMVQLLDSSLASPLARAVARQTGLVDFIRVSYQEDDTASNSNVSGSDPRATSSTNLTQNEFLRYVKGTKVQMGRELSRRLFADYSVRVDEYQNQVDLRHEVELAYRVHRSLYLRAVSELDSERTLGRPPDHRALLENQWRFGLPRRKKNTEKIEPSPLP